MTQRESLPRTPLWLDAWIGVGVGAILLLWEPRWLQWASSRMLHTHFDEFTDNATGAVVPYQSLFYFWMDLGPTLFGVVLIVDGLLLFIRTRSAVAIAFALTVFSTAFNAGWLVYSYGEHGLAPLSLVAVVFGVYLAAHQWSALGLRRTAADSVTP